MTWTLAPVAFSKSGARRCSGSAICGPVNVTTRIVVPLKLPVEVELLELQAASRPTPTAMTRALARYRLMSFSSPSRTRKFGWPRRPRQGPLPPIIRMFNLLLGICQASSGSNGPFWPLVIRRLLESGCSRPCARLEREPLQSTMENPAQDRHRHQRDDQGGGGGGPVELTLEREEIHHRHRHRLDLSGGQHQRDQQQIPCEYEEHDRGCGDARCGEWQHDLPENPEQPRPIEDCRLFP